MSPAVPFFAPEAVVCPNLFTPESTAATPAPSPSLCSPSAKMSLAQAAPSKASSGAEDDAAALLQLHLQLSQQLQRSAVTEEDLFRALKKLALNSGSGNASTNTPAAGQGAVFLGSARQSGNAGAAGDFPAAPAQDAYARDLRPANAHGGGRGVKGGASAGRSGSAASGLGAGSLANAASHTFSSLSFHAASVAEGVASPRAGAGSWRCRCCSTVNVGALPSRCVCCGRTQGSKRGGSGAKGVSAAPHLLGSHASAQGAMQPNLPLQQLFAAVTAAAAAAEKRAEDKKEAKRAAAAVSAVATAMTEPHRQQDALLSQSQLADPLYFARSERIGGHAGRGGLAPETVYDDSAAAAAVAASLLPGLLGSLEAAAGGGTASGNPPASGASPSTCLTQNEGAAGGRSHHALSGAAAGAPLFSSSTSSACFENDSAAASACIGRASAAGLISDLGSLGTGLGSLKGSRNRLATYDASSAPGGNLVGEAGAPGLRQGARSVGEGGGSSPGTASLLQDASTAYGVDMTVFQELASAPQSTFFTDDVTPVDSLSLLSDCRSPSGATPSSMVSGRSSFCNAGAAAGGGGRESNGNTSSTGGSTNGSTPLTGGIAVGGSRGSASGGAAGASGVSGSKKSGSGTLAADATKPSRGDGQVRPPTAKPSDVGGLSGFSHPLPFGSLSQASTMSFSATTPSTQGSLPQQLQTPQNQASPLLLLRGDTSTSSSSTFLRSASSSPSAMEGEEESPIGTLLGGVGAASSVPASGLEGLLPTGLSPLQVLLLKAKGVVDKLVNDFAMLGYGDPSAKATEALRTSLAILGQAPLPQSLGGPEEDFPGAGSRGNSGRGKTKPSDLLGGSGKDNDDETARKPKNANWMQGIGGPHFSAPPMLAHPDEFKNPSSFLKIYGDPMCAVVDAATPAQGSRSTGGGGRLAGGIAGRVDGPVTGGGSTSPSSNLPIRGHNGNWVCESCSNVNFPRRFRCNKCGAVRGPQGDAIVAEYAKLVYHQHVKTYKSLAARPGVDLPLKRLQGMGASGANSRPGSGPGLPQGMGGTHHGTLKKGTPDEGTFPTGAAGGSSVSSSTRHLGSPSASADLTGGLNLAGVQGRGLGSSQATMQAGDSRKPPPVPQPPSVAPHCGAGLPQGGDSSWPMNFAGSFGAARCGSSCPVPPPPATQPRPMTPAARAPAQAEAAAATRVLLAGRAVGLSPGSLSEEKKGLKKFPPSEGALQQTPHEAGTVEKEKSLKLERSKETRAEEDASKPLSGAISGSKNEGSLSGLTTCSPVSSVPSPRAADSASSSISSGGDNENKS
ncbi:Zn-finger in Ran binding protein and others domain-containing protein [Besnoitia besnoiti]|uniref:Zn-finger in Ran binding protein and others domain-containing protein n=1 Tax=Besnoitia besnoiti TaxID=94643 RepID=A0A2A9M4X4_BESBE|nr:Zn-finger in Ran binding protein and others domain-containing protein [Besnoitia besnoiti]PFH31351.1 Zn-finger in Ran binding protein and others domain-containing protein [Besnoitia besnoiti]